MGVDVNIFLEPHAKTEQIFKVIFKVLGGDFEQKYFQGYHIGEFHKPSSINNKWYLEPIMNSDTKIELKDPTYFKLSFKSCSGQHLTCLIHLDCEEGHIPICKALMPQSNAIWCAIGKRLVDFFGGKLQYCDDKNENNPMNYYLVTNPKFPSRKIDDDSNERFYQFINLLHQETVLNAQEINSMKEHCSQFTEEDKNMIFFLEKFVPAQELNKELNINDNAEKPNKKKLKV
jgi:hypothetical protein